MGRIAILTLLLCAAVNALAQNFGPTPRNTTDVAVSFQSTATITSIAVSSSPATTVISSSTALGSIRQVSVLNLCGSGYNLYCGFTTSVQTSGGSNPNIGWKILPSTSQPAGFTFPLPPGANLYCINDSGSAACNAVLFYGR
jgi:hypothetical protein